MIIFSDERIKQMSATELAMLSSLNGETFTDTAAENREAILAYVKKYRAKEDAETNYQQQLESKFV